MAQGIGAACQELGVFVLGGDTIAARIFSLTGCAVRYVPTEKRLAAGRQQENEGTLRIIFSWWSKLLGLQDKI